MYVDDFNDRRRVKKVYIQGEPGLRISPQGSDKWYAHSNGGDMVPFISFATGEWIYDSPKLEQYSGVSTVRILGEPAPGYSSGDAMKAIEDIAARFPKGSHISWIGLSFEERPSGFQAPTLHALSPLTVLLCLATLCEGRNIPLSVMSIVPLGVLGVVCTILLRGLGNDVFSQIDLLTTIGLSTKNAIPIVEFARELYEKGRPSIKEVAVEAARVRLRPITMTSLAFAMGVIPLAASTRTSSGSEHAIGTGVIRGMITAMVLAIFYILLFYMLIAGSSSRGDKKSSDRTEAEQP